MLGLSLLGGVGFTLVEGLPLGDAFYFTMVTMTTVGYGDIHPTTGLGKVLAVVVMLGGVGSFTGVVANATELMVSRQNRRLRLAKVNMVAGVFFSELGEALLESFALADPQRDRLNERLRVRGAWKANDFQTARKAVTEAGQKIEPEKIDMEGLRDLLREKRDLLLRLLENPQLLEHESFTELIQASFHLHEELMHRDSFADLPESDLNHLAGDMVRVYSLLVWHWLGYLEHLKTNYPYLFSLAVRLNPFTPERSAIVR